MSSSIHFTTEAANRPLRFLDQRLYPQLRAIKQKYGAGGFRLLRVTILKASVL
jgi:hypothetical protein